MNKSALANTKIIQIDSDGKLVSDGNGYNLRVLDVPLDNDSVGRRSIVNKAVDLSKVNDDIIAEFELLKGKTLDITQSNVNIQEGLNYFIPANNDISEFNLNLLFTRNA